MTFKAITENLNKAVSLLTGTLSPEVSANRDEGRRLIEEASGKLGTYPLTLAKNNAGELVVHHHEPWNECDRLEKVLLRTDAYTQVSAAISNVTNTIWHNKEGFVDFEDVSKLVDGTGIAGIDELEAELSAEADKLRQVQSLLRHPEILKAAHDAIVEAEYARSSQDEEIDDQEFWSEGLKNLRRNREMSAASISLEPDAESTPAATDSEGI